MSDTARNEGIDQAETIKLAGPSLLTGTVSVPGDKSISHRALLFAAIADGDSYITGLSSGDDVQRTLQGLRQFGVDVKSTAKGLAISGGIRREPAEQIDLGNSGTAMRLFAALSSGQDAFTVLKGDQYLLARPMDRVTLPLRAMGARIDGRSNGRLAPLAVRGGGLKGIEYQPPVASAQVKSSVLLAGLFAHGATTVSELVPTRIHTEEMLADFGCEVITNGSKVTVHPTRLSATTINVPGDPSQAAFWIVAALICPGSAVTIEDIYLGYGRSGFVDVLARMGANLQSDSSGTIRAMSGPMIGVTIGPDDIPGLVDEVPVIAVAAAFAKGTTVISGAAELRVKESDRITATVAMLKAFGVDAIETVDGMVIHGGTPSHEAIIDAHGDHRIAMAACVFGLAVSGTTVIRGWASVRTSYPGFAADVERLTLGNVALSSVE